MVELNNLAADPERAAEAIPRLRKWLTTVLPTGYRGFLHQSLLRALIMSQSPIEQIIAQADTVESFGVGDRRYRVNFSYQIADALLRREAWEAAARYAERARSSADSIPDPAAAATCEGLLGRAQLGMGRVEDAIASLRHAVASARDSHAVLGHLGRALERAGRPDEAIDTYVRALGVFPAPDSGVVAPLHALYQKAHGSLEGLEQRITAARAASRERIALEPRRHEGPAPAWSLPDLEGRTVRDADFRGKVLVLDFWGSWCGPCRAEIPHIQSAYERYKDQGVEVVGINWERMPTPEERRQAARDFIAEHRLSFTNVLDLERTAVEAYSIDSFPTAYVIDREGRIRYRNVGFSPDIGEILTAQIESLIEGPGSKAAEGARTRGQ
jgi:thiol-disulfide isomerase/thioredoxin